MSVATGTVRSSAPGRTPRIINLVGPVTPNTEFSLSLTSGTKQFMLKTRDRHILKLSYTVGESGSNYLTIYPNSVYSVDGVSLDNTTLYLQTNGSSTVVEIVEWS